MTEEERPKPVRDVFQTREGRLIVYNDGREEFEPNDPGTEPEELPVSMYRIDSTVATPKYPHP